MKKAKLTAIEKIALVGIEEGVAPSESLEHKGFSANEIFAYELVKYVKLMQKAFTDKTVEKIAKKKDKVVKINALNLGGDSLILKYTFSYAFATIELKVLTKKKSDSKLKVIFKETYSFQDIMVGRFFKIKRNESDETKGSLEPIPIVEKHVVDAVNFIYEIIDNFIISFAGEYIDKIVRKVDSEVIRKVITK